MTQEERWQANYDEVIFCLFLSITVVLGCFFSYAQMINWLAER